MLIDKIDGKAALISLDQSLAYCSINTHFWGAVLSIQIQTTWINLCHPKCYSRNEQGKIEAFHVDQIYSSKLSAFAYVVHFYRGTFSVKVESEPGTI